MSLLAIAGTVLAGIIIPIAGFFIKRWIDNMIADAAHDEAMRVAEINRREFEKQLAEQNTKLSDTIRANQKAMDEWIKSQKDVGSVVQN